jgi:ABC-2 type transport system permease protein
MTLTQVLPRTLRSRLAWGITDTWVITRRDLAHWARQPGAVIASTLLFQHRCV